MRRKERNSKRTRKKTRGTTILALTGTEASLRASTVAIRVASPHIDGRRLALRKRRQTATPRTPSFAALRPRSSHASIVAKASSRKRDTRCELALRRALHAHGLRYRVDVSTLPGRPDIVFPRAKVAIFCDGDFWHGRRLQARISKLATGYNSEYWIAKVTRNVERDRQQRRKLRRMGWTVLRFWETDILRNTAVIANKVRQSLRASNRRTSLKI
jgi:DNA mismatch endonuclease, patch repair protein